MGISIFLIFSYGALNSQSPYYHFDEFTASELKLHNGVVQVYQDHMGYLWFCGFDGVTRYNGNEFKSLVELYPEASKIKVKSFRSIYIDSDYTIWLSSLGSGLIRISNGNVEDFDSLTKDDQNLPSKSLFDAISIQNQVWITGDFGLRVYQRQNDHYELLQIDHIPNTKKVIDISSFDSKSIWLSDNEAIYRYDVISEEFKQFDDFPKSRVSKDINGNVWILKRDSGNFLYKHDSKLDSFRLNEKQPFSSVDALMTIAWDHQNRIWASVFNSQIYMADMNTVELLLTEDKHHNLEFTQFSRRPLVDNSGAVWIVNGSAYMLPYSSGFNPIQFDATNNKLINGFHVGEDYAVMSVQGEGLVVVEKKTGMQKTYTKENSDLAYGHASFVRKIGNGKYALGMVNFFQIFDVKKGFVKTIRTKD